MKTLLHSVRVSILS